MHTRLSKPAALGGRGSALARAAVRAAALVALAAACTNAPPNPEAPACASATGREAAPYWASQPLSWAQLSEIEDWIHSREASRKPYWRVEGELTLAEGRVRLADQDGSRGADQGVLATRRQAAREGFQRVLDDPDALAEQRVRARRGLAAVGGAATPPATDGPLVTRGQWGAEAPVRSRLNPIGRDYRKITVHHSAEIPGFTLDGRYDNSVMALRKIQNYHIHNQGWGDIGYHYLIDGSGRIFEGRSDRWQGAHAGGNANIGNLGICLLGDFRGHRPSPEALASLQRLVDDYRARYGIPRSQVVPHQDLKNTECPGKHLAAWVRSYSEGGLAPGSAAPLIGTGRTTTASAPTPRAARTYRATGNVR